VIGLEAFNSLAGENLTRETFLDALNVRASPSETGRHVRLNTKVYDVNKRLYANRLSEAIAASIPQSYGEKRNENQQPFHKAREHGAAEEVEFIAMQMRIEEEKREEEEQRLLRAEAARAAAEEQRRLQAEAATAMAEEQRRLQAEEAATAMAEEQRRLLERLQKLLQAQGKIAVLSINSTAGVEEQEDEGDEKDKMTDC
jgi:hypothetical protein